MAGGPVALVARSQVRRRWRALVALTLFVGVLGGISLALLQGSRRSATVVDRYFAQATHYDLALQAPTLTRAQVLHLPHVRRADLGAYVAMVAPIPGSSPQAGINGQAVNFDSVDPTVQVLDGRIPGHAADGIVVNQDFVREFGKSVGDSVTVQMFGVDQMDEVSNGVYHPTGPRYRLRIAAVVRMTQDVALDDVKSLSVSGYHSRNQVLVPEAFYERHKHEFLDFGEAFDVQLDGAPHARAELTRAARVAAGGGRDAVQLGPSARQSTRRDALRDPVRLETTALLALGAGIALVTALATLLLIRNEQRLHDGDGPVLRGLGCTNGQIGRAAALRTLPVAVVAAVLAVGVAVALSGRFPIGIGRQLELSPGIQPNLAVLGIGALAIVAVVLGGAAALGRVRSPRAESTRAPNGLARWLARVGAPVDAVLGTHLAFQRGRGARSTAARSTVAAGAVSLAIVSALAVYVAGIDTTHDRTAAHGWPWDVVIGNTNFPLSGPTEHRLASDRRIARWTRALLTYAVVDGASTEVIGFDPAGSAPPTVVAGRLPRADGEIALGRGALAARHAHVGDTVDVAFQDTDGLSGGAPPKPRRMTIVGVAAPPALGESDQDRMGLVTLGGIRAAGAPTPHQLVLARVTGPNRIRQLDDLRHAYSEEMATDVVPARVNNLYGVRRLPVLGLLLAGAMGTFLLVYALAVSARVRRRELAILRTLGATGHGVRRVLAAQGLVLATLMLVLGVPLGLVLGNALARGAIENIGLAPSTTVPAALFLVVPGALGVAILASVLPARRAIRDRIVVPLRAE